MDVLRGIETFVKTVEAGSIAEGARRLGISPAAASQNIARLEAYLGTRLLTRTTRRLALTDSGAIYYGRVRTIAREIAIAGEEAALGATGQPQGRLRIASSAAFARHVLSPLIPEFTRLYPRVAVELLATDRNLDHIKESIDVSIRIKAQLHEGLVARWLATVPSKFCASPDYLQRAGCPIEPEELQQHDCLVFRYPADGRFLKWGFIREGNRFEVDVNAAIVSDDIDVLARLAVGGGGITRLAAFVADPYIANGQLTELFTPPGKASTCSDIEPLEFYLCVPDRHAVTPKVKSFMDYVTSAVPSKWRKTDQPGVHGAAYSGGGG